MEREGTSGEKLVEKMREWKKEGSEVSLLALDGVLRRIEKNDGDIERTAHQIEVIINNIKRMTEQNVHNFLLG